MVIGGYRWLWVVIHGYTLVIDGYTRLYIVIDGYGWLYMVIDGYWWLYMVIGGYIHCYSRLFW